MNEILEPRPQMREELSCEKHAPSKVDILREYDINIRFLNRGCIVSVGCKQIAFESHESAIKEFNDYVNNPYEKQKEWRKII